MLFILTMLTGEQELDGHQRLFELFFARGMEIGTAREISIRLVIENILLQERTVDPQQTMFPEPQIS